MIRRILLKLKQGTEHLNYGRHIVRGWCRDYIEKSSARTLNVLDVGMGTGGDLEAAMQEAGNRRVALHGIELDPKRVERARARGVKVYPLDIERGKIPLGDGALDIVIANQIIEHTKELFWVFSEISRTLRKGGVAIVGVPNLASFHNRIALLFGQQPTCIRLLSPHIRGFTKPDFIEFITRQGYFKVLKVKGSNFYPFPPWLSGMLSRLVPTMSVSLFFLVQRTGKKGRFIEVLAGMDLETPYFTGGREGKRKK